MAIQSQSAARARSDAVVGAILIAIVAVVAAGVYTFMGWTSTSSTTSQDVQNALIDVRAGEKAPLWTSADIPKALIAIRAAEREGRGRRLGAPPASTRGPGPVRTGASSCAGGSGGSGATRHRRPAVSRGRPGGVAVGRLRTPVVPVPAVTPKYGLLAPRADPYIPPSNRPDSTRDHRWGPERPPQRRNEAYRWHRWP